jgi:hypothetical protein
MKCGWVAAMDAGIPARSVDDEAFDLGSLDDPPLEDEFELTRKLVLWLEPRESIFNPLGDGARVDLKKSSLEPKLKLDMVGRLGSLKFESCQLSLIAFSRLFTCSETFSNRVSSPRETIDRARYTRREPSEFERRSLGVERLSIPSLGSGASARGVMVAVEPNSRWGSGAVFGSCGRDVLLGRELLLPSTRVTWSYSKARRPSKLAKVLDLGDPYIELDCFRWPAPSPWRKRPLSKDVTENDGREKLRRFEDFGKLKEPMYRLSVSVVELPDIALRRTP